MQQPTILLGLNEINFDYIKFYANQGKLPVLKSLLAKHPLIETESEKKYQLLEPWIQWVTIHTGKTYDEHQVFRLGDITERKDLKQLWETFEEKGVSVGAISPFNADNRLKNPSFFVPDPWTKTNASGNWLVRNLSDAVQQTVNDNAQSKLSLKSIFSLLLGLLVYVPPTKWFKYLSLGANIRKAGTKAIILDNLLGDIFLKLWKKHRPEFSSLFLNTGAHVQHHYLFNSQAYEGEFENPDWYCPKGYDPLEKVLVEYDDIIGRLLKLNTKVIVATGLHQKPHKHLTYYWRLKKHDAFLKKIGVQNYTEVLPRMSRDMLVEFPSEKAALAGQQIFESYEATADQTKIFVVDNRGKSLFVELTYPNDITDNFSIQSNSGPSVDNFKEEVSFVAIKNGEHDGIGYLLTNFDTELSGEIIPLKRVNQFILDTVLTDAQVKIA